MQTPKSFYRLSALAGLVLAAGFWSGCSDQEPSALTAPSFAAQQADDLAAAIAAQERHTDALLRIPGVVGTAVGLLPTGRPIVRVFVTHAEVRGVPAGLDGVPARVEVTGQFVAFSDPTTRQRPAPLGFSVGHPAITAGTIGARVVDGSGNVYILSNNHVLANGNAATVGDAALQPGPYDGGTSADQIGTLAAFKPIVFTSTASNTIDAAIALSNTNDLGNTTPADDGYGAPSGTIWGDANADGVFDNKSALLGLDVQKYGRTTKLTTGQITGINATITVCYEAFVFCTKLARFVDQIIIEPGTFSDGGDSGSLIVTNDGNRNPVALLFAGSTTQTIANRIDLVLNEFDVDIDAGESPPPTPVTDVAITGVSAPTSVTQGDDANVLVTVRNVGNQDVAASFAVTLRDATDDVTLGTQSVSGLTAGGLTTLSFTWNTTGSSTGAHTLTASHDLADDVSSNNQASTTSTVNLPGTGDGLHVGDLDGVPAASGKNTWSATVEVTVHDAGHLPINGATVRGVWNPAGLASDQCETGELGGSGTCIFLFPSIKKGTRSVTFTVTSITMAGRTYLSSANHDVDGSSNGTVVTVRRP
jgi:hypothetical protein